LRDPFCEKSEPRIEVRGSRKRLGGIGRGGKKLKKYNKKRKENEEKSLSFSLLRNTSGVSTGTCTKPPASKVQGGPLGGVRGELEGCASARPHGGKRLYKSLKEKSEKFGN